jgi:hypothetical protein
MNDIFSLPSNGTSSEWVMFAIMVIAIGLAVGLVAVWAVVYRPKSKKRKHKHRRKRHNRQHNPTLAEKGGLPPLRSPNQPPPGP